MTEERGEDVEKKEPWDLWWLVQLYFIISLVIFFLEAYHNSFRIAVPELVAAGLAYAGPASFIAAFRSRRERRHGWLTLTGLFVLAVVVASAAVGLMFWTDFRIHIQGVEIEGVHWVLIGIVISLIAGRKEDEV